MSLYDIKNKLYKREKDEKLSQLSRTGFDPRFAPMDIAKKSFSKEDAWITEAEQSRLAKRKIWRTGFIIAGSLVLFILLLWGFFKFRQTSFSQDRVEFSLSGPQEALSGKSLTYAIKYKNNNRSALKNAVLKINFPKNFIPEDNPDFRMEGTSSSILNLGDIADKKEGSVEFKGKIFSPKGALIYLKAEINYTPSSLGGQFVSQSQLSVAVQSSPVKLEMSAPQNLANGDAIDYQINYQNDGEKEIAGMKVKMEYPEGFVFSKADPLNSEGNNFWHIGTLAPGQSGKIVVSGKLSGERNYIRTAKAYIGIMDGEDFVIYDEENTATQINDSPLIIRQAVNGQDNLNVNLGELLRFEIKFRNDGEIGLRDVIVTEKLEGEALDYASLKLEKGGAFDSNSKIITWKASDFSDLEKFDPGQEGSIKFVIKIKDSLLIEKNSDKNFIISSIAKIDSQDVPTPIEANKIISGNRMDMKLNSKVALETVGYYYDSVIENSGPIPPQVGKETTYAIHWKISNAMNDLSEAKIEAVIPTGATVTEVKNPADANLHYTFNERTNNLVWEIGNIESGAGILNSPREVVFQVKINPSPDQIGSPVNLVDETTFSAKDLFTGEEIKFSGNKKTTNLREDTKLERRYKVIPAN
jgi:hypothetical protein